MIRALRLLVQAPALALPAPSPEPSYAEWTRTLQVHYHPDHGMDYDWSLNRWGGPGR